MQIFEANDSFNFDNIRLSKPSLVANGVYLTKISYQASSTASPLYIQTPISTSKQGVQTTNKGKKMFIDLSFDKTQVDFLQWIENLETCLQQKIFEKREAWFTADLEKGDIDNAFNPILKIYKSGACCLLRSNIQVRLNMPVPKIFNEHEEELGIQDIKEDTHLMSVLEFQGIRFSNKYFIVEVDCKQILVVNPNPFEEKCFINRGAPKTSNPSNSTQDRVSEEEPAPIIKEIPTEQLTLDIKETNFAIQTDDHIRDPDPDPNVDAMSISDFSICSEDIEIEEGNEDEDLSDDEEDEDLSDDDQDEEDENGSLENYGKPPIKIGDEVSSSEEGIIEIDPIEQHLVDDLSSSTNDSSSINISIKPPNEIYFKMYQEAKEKAKEAKKNALKAYLECKEIKKTYMLDDISSSSDEEEDDDPVA